MLLLLATIASAIGARAESSSTRAAADAMQRNQRAEQAYRARDLDEAASEWLAYLDQSVAQPPAERARVLYNLGNVAFRQNKVLESVGWYTAALRLRPRDGDTWRNLEHARTAAKLDPADRGDLAATLERLLTSLTPSESERLFAGVLLVWAACLAVEALRGGRTWRLISIVATALVVLGALPLVVVRARESAERMLVISSERVALHSEPRGDAAAVGELAPGDAVERLDALPEWVKVESASGAVGWVKAGAVFDLRR
ncbi:MAG: SH3 domain-containing protein [Planctomycetota bacterium]